MDKWGRQNNFSKQRKTNQCTANFSVSIVNDFNALKEKKTSSEWPLIDRTRMCSSRIEQTLTCALVYAQINVMPM